VLELESLVRDEANWPHPMAMFELSADRSNNSTEKADVETRPWIDSTHAALYTDGVSMWFLAVLELSGANVQVWGVSIFAIQCSLSTHKAAA